MVRESARRCGDDLRLQGSPTWVNSMIAPIATVGKRHLTTLDCRNVHVLIEQVPGEQIVEGRVCRLREKNQREMAGIISSMHRYDIL